MEMKKLTIYVLGILKAQLCITLACSVPLFVERRTCFIIGVEFLHGDDHGQEGKCPRTIFSFEMVRSCLVVKLTDCMAVSHLSCIRKS